MVESKKERKSEKTKHAKTAKIAVARVRGRIELKGTIQDTLDMIGLRKVNWVAVIDTTPTYMGMIKKAKDYITWGELEEAVFRQLVEKWGRKAGDARLTKAEADEFAKKFMAGETTFKKSGIRPVFKLHPPSKGHANGGIKKHVSVGGVLGDRGEGINDLIARMAGLRQQKK